MTQFEDTALVADASGQYQGETHFLRAARNLIAGAISAGDGHASREPQTLHAVTKPIPVSTGRQAKRDAKPNSALPADNSATAGKDANRQPDTNCFAHPSEDVPQGTGEANFLTKTRPAAPRQPHAGKPARSAMSLTKPVTKLRSATHPAQPGGAGQLPDVTQSANASTATIDGQKGSDPHLGRAVMGGSEGHYVAENQCVCADTIAQLIQLTRMRRRWHKAEKSLTLQGKAMARAWFAGDKDEANKAFTQIEKGGCKDASLVMAVTPFLMAREPFEIERAAIEKTMRKLARSLPVWSAWAEGVKGLGDLRLAIIVGECGDIGSYKSVSAVWKRMGLAVIDGGRQRRVAGDAALEHGYNPERRAIAYVMGTEILKAQVRNVKDEDGKRTDESRAIGPYGELYLERKAYEAGRDGITKAHANNRAARYMVKRVLRDLYGAWC